MYTTINQEEKLPDDTILTLINITEVKTDIRISEILNFTPNDRISPLK